MHMSAEKKTTKNFWLSILKAISKVHKWIMHEHTENKEE